MDWQSIFQIYGYPLLFVLLALEGQPFMLLAGFLVSLGYFNFWLVLLFGLPAIVLGDYGFHWLAFRYGRGIIAKHGRFLFLTPGVIKKLENFLLAHGHKTVIITKFIYGFGRNSLIVMGLTGHRLKNYFWQEVLGTGLSLLLFTFIGFYMGESWQVLETYLKGFGYALIGVVLIILLASRLGVGRTLKKNNNHDELK